MIRRLPILLAVLLLSHVAMAIKPLRKYYQTPDSVGMAYRPTRIGTPDKLHLQGWDCSPDEKLDKRTTIVLAYGDAGNMGGWVHMAKELTTQGYRVLLFDYRGFGQSDDFALDQQQLYYNEFADDLGAALAYARRQYPRNRTGVLAFSMGTIMATKVAARTKLDFLIGEGYVADPVWHVANIKQLKNKVVTLPAAAEQYKLLPPRIRCLMLLVAGTADAFTPLAHSEQVVGTATGKQVRRLVKFEGGHLEGSAKLSQQHYADAYVQLLSQFLADTGAGAKRRKA
ncbi:alpha/beta fold hydrolase [Hymenobacter oligotrophus]|uniref:Alpha/beta fold hydrolase n=1 Tax=Hymenobacter oligotrophus TaxID=2319843 RepID=A0A3B7RAN8_9BACT|nr:alpha/beta fold hydrolase [Hymenobacter oligotrophus]AYA36616.1 alpha/beta fold hydrolase [Hymenobacter oligotrophus]